MRARPGGRSGRIRILVMDATRQELEMRGYGALSHRAVAARAGVDPSTVYRRWPTRSRLAADALLEVARAAVPVPDSGTLAGDLEQFLGSVVAVLSEPRLRRQFHALSAAGAEAGGELEAMLRRFWSVRFSGAEEMIVRAVERGELPDGVDAHQVIETLVAPAYFRALVTSEPFDSGFVRMRVTAAVAAVSG